MSGIPPVPVSFPAAPAHHEFVALSLPSFVAARTMLELRSAEGARVHEFRVVHMSTGEARSLASSIWASSIGAPAERPDASWFRPINRAQS